MALNNEMIIDDLKEEIRELNNEYMELENDYKLLQKESKDYIIELKRTVKDLQGQLTETKYKVQTNTQTVDYLELMNRNNKIKIAELESILKTYNYDFSLTETQEEESLIEA